MSLDIPSTASLSTGLVWFKGTDLRLRDNLAVSTAHRTCDQVVHTFVVDPANFRLSPTNSAKYSFKRLRFLGESLADLHTSLKLNGSRLNVIVGPTDIALSNIASGLGNCNFYFHDEYIYEERQLLTRTLSALKPICDELHPFWGGATLYEPEDLTEPISQLEQFTAFRKAMEGVPIKAPISQPEVFRTSPCIAAFESSECILIRDEQMNVSGIIHALRSVAESELCNSNNDDLYLFGSHLAPLVSGGESFGWSRIEYYILSGTGRLSCYKDTRNGMVGMDFSSKLSYWLSTGSITARQIALAVQQYESDSGISNDSTRFLLFELLWRDYMKFYGMRWKEKMFCLGGPQGEVGRKKQPWRTDVHLISAWKNGKTGYPLIDANMRELYSTGYMSNRGRQIVASFLVRDMGQDWRVGAEYFESQLLDFDVCSNYGNWQYSAGVGSDPRDDRYFNIIKQGICYDPEAKYMKLWCPELSHLPAELLHDPYLISSSVRRAYGVEEDMYPSRCVDLLNKEFKLQSRGAMSKKKKEKMEAHGKVPGLFIDVSQNVV